jgi:hypothetical protein
MSVFSKFLGIARVDSLQLNDGSSANIGSTIYQKRVTLTSTQVLALHGTPVALVAAPGTGKYISISEVMGYVTFNANAYSGSNNVEFRYTDGSGAKVTGDAAAAWLNSGSSAAVKCIAAAVTPVANAAVVAVVPVANPTAGDSTVTFELKYRIVTLP